ncbi:MAG TPA: glucoamylase family protein [Flavitalea sp.]|nr:glucoamylase family protein [Flavitalea sp.]
MFIKRLLLIVVAGYSFASAQEPGYDHSFFLNSRMKGSYFYSKVSYRSPSWIKNVQEKLPVSETYFFTPGNSLQLNYRNGSTGKWNAAIIKTSWRGQDNIKEGNILSLKLFVNSASTTATDLPAVQIAKRDSVFSQAVPMNNYITTLPANKWLSITIPMKDFEGIVYNKSSEVVGMNFLQNANDGKEHSIFVDDIEILSNTHAPMSTNTPAITVAKGFAKHVDIEWEPVNNLSVKHVKVYRSFDGKAFTPVGVQSPCIKRYADYIGEPEKNVQYKISFVGYDYAESRLSAAVSARTKSMTDDEMLTMVQEACFRYYYEAAEKESGLAKENIPGRHNMIAMGASGFGIMAMIVGTERKFISRNEAVERFLKIVNFLEKTETFHGAFSHFVDGPTKKAEPFFGRRDNGGDLVETSFLLQGLLAARAYFNKGDSKEKQIRDKITAIWQNVEWNWYRREESKNYLTWHWSPDQAWIIDHQLIGWNETMVTYLLAIASPSHPVPAGLYYSGWASQEDKAQQYRKNWGQTDDGSMYKNDHTYFGISLPVGVSNGGPLFFTHYSYLGYDPHQLKDIYTNYFENNRNIALINHRYCVENPGGYKGYTDSCWGLTAGDAPFQYSASEPVLRMDDGKIVPTGAIASFPYTPEQSMKALKNYYNNYGHFLWGEYGFRDAFNLTENWCSEIFMGLNQAPMVVMIENHRTGLLWDLFMKIPEIQTGLKRISGLHPH